MGTHQKDRQDQTTGKDPQHQGTSQVGTHANPEATRPTDQPVDPATREMRQGDRTDPAMPQGTTPLERDQRPINQQR